MLVRKAMLRECQGQSFLYFQIVPAVARPSTSSPPLLTKKKKLPVATPSGPWTDLSDYKAQ